MARIGGRSLWLAWPVGIVCAAVVATLVWLAVPALPAAWALGSDILRGPAAAAPPSDDVAAPRECRGLYSDALWAGLTWTAGSTLSQDDSVPATTATVLAEALAPQVRFSCTWRADDGSIATTLADVGSDAGAIALASLPALGFTCSNVAETRVHCARTDGVVVETIELGEGLWLSTSQTSWHPQRYAGRVAAEVWSR